MMNWFHFEKESVRLVIKKRVLKVMANIYYLNPLSLYIKENK